MGKRYPKLPVVGVGGLIKEENKVLLVRRKNPPGQGMWSLPGGLLELGEKITQGLVREVAEETGLIVEPACLLDVLELIMPDEQGRVEYHYILFNYLCHAIGGQLRAGSDAGQAAWFSVNEFDNNVWPDTVKLVGRVLRGNG